MCCLCFFNNFRNGLTPVAQAAPVPVATEEEAATQGKNVHVHVAAPNVEVEVQSLKHAEIAKPEVDVTPNVS